MYKKLQKVIYNKPSALGTGKIPVGAEGSVLLFVEHPVTTKLLIDFHEYGKAIIPLSSLKIVEE